MIPFAAIILATLLGAATYFVRSTAIGLHSLNERVSILIEHNVRTDSDVAEIKKYHDEIIDLKVASATFEERTKNL